MQTASRTSTELNRFPQWMQEIVGETQHTAKRVADHKAWHLFSDGTIPPAQHHALLYNFWPLIDKFPHFLALNVLKCPYTSNPVVNDARKWLIRNLRVEQKHAEWYKDWAECAGVPMEKFFDGPRTGSASAITDWAWSGS